MWNRCIAAVALVLALAATAEAQRDATILLRSGERISGSFQDIHNNLVYMRLSFHEERRIPVDEVALIDFVGGTRGLPETEIVAAREEADLLILQNGRSYRGTLVDVTGEGENERLEIIFRTGEGTTMRALVTDVGRLYLGRLPDLSGVPGAIATTGSTPAPAPQGGLFAATAGWVAANQQWTSTGLTVRQGEMVSFNADGQIQLGGDHVAGPAGSRRQLSSAIAPLPGELMGALIARVGNSEPFAIGDLTRPIRMPASGTLLLGVNLGSADLATATGGFSVAVTPQASRIRVP